MDIQAIILSAIPFVLGIGVVWIRAERILRALKELAEVLSILAISLEDKKLTPEELDKIKKEFSEAIGAIKAIVKK